MHVCDNKKTRGMGVRQKLKNQYCRAYCGLVSLTRSPTWGDEWKKPFVGSSHAKGIVLEQM